INGLFLLLCVLLFLLPPNVHEVLLFLLPFSLLQNVPMRIVPWQLNELAAKGQREKQNGLIHALMPFLLLLNVCWRQVRAADLFHRLARHFFLFFPRSGLSKVVSIPHQPVWPLTDQSRSLVLPTWLHVFPCGCALSLHVQIHRPVCSGPCLDACRVWP